MIYLFISLRFTFPPSRNILRDSCHPDLTEQRSVRGRYSLDHICNHTFLTSQGHRRPPWMSDRLNTSATSDTIRTYRQRHHLLTHSYLNKVTMMKIKMIMMAIWWSFGSKVSWHLSGGWGEIPENTDPGPLLHIGEFAEHITILNLIKRK